MRILHISFVDIDHHGIANKVRNQALALALGGDEVDFYRYENSGFFFNSECLCHTSKHSKLKRKIIEVKITKAIIDEKDLVYDLVYIRSMRITPWFFLLIKHLKSKSKKLVLEFPVFPYDGVYSRFSIPSIIDKIYRKLLWRYVDIALYNGDLRKEIFNIPAIQVFDYVDPANVPLKKSGNRVKKIKFIAVAKLAEWHGYDRFIKSIAAAKYDIRNSIVLNIVGDGPSLIKLKKLVIELDLERVVFFQGVKTGRELDMLFDQSNIALAALAVHRVGISTIAPIKSVEYAARGMPLIIGYDDPRFRNSDFVQKVPGDDSLIDIEKIVTWYLSCSFDPSEIRKFVLDNYSWSAFSKVVLSLLR
jgi:glycosyltransferase involved in cell wall biosynthesis